MKRRPWTARTLIGILLFLFICAVSFLAGGRLPDTAGPRGKQARIILISIDSCSAAYFESGKLPKLTRHLESGGVGYSGVLTCMTAETMSGHTTMLTGTFPATSGIIGNGMFNPETGEDIAVVQDPRHRKVPTVFEELRQLRNISTGSADGPGHGAVSTAFISGKWRLPGLLAQGADYIGSSPVIAALFKQKGRFGTGPALDLSAHTRRETGYPSFHFEGDVYDPWTLRTSLTAIRELQPGFTFINLAWLDRSGHDTGSFNFNTYRHLRYLDTGLLQFFYDLHFSGLYKETLFIVTADHGMDPVSSYFNPAVELQKFEIDIDHTHSEGHCAFLFLKDTDDKHRARDILASHPLVKIAASGEGLSAFQLDPRSPLTGDVFINCIDKTIINFKGLPMIYLGMHGGVQTREVPLYFSGPGAKRLRPPPIENTAESAGDVTASIADIVPTLYDLWELPTPNYIEGQSLYGK
jgi:predicted AlkP superfamily pyrophosphatase or phosphodiesterase